jgi:hypothetical protein
MPEPTIVATNRAKRIEPERSGFADAYIYLPFVRKLTTSKIIVKENFLHYEEILFPEGCIYGKNF